MRIFCLFFLLCAKLFSVQISQTVYSVGINSTFNPEFVALFPNGNSQTIAIPGVIGSSSLVAVPTGGTTGGTTIYVFCTNTSAVNCVTVFQDTNTYTSSSISYVSTYQNINTFVPFTSAVYIPLAVSTASQYLIAISSSGTIVSVINLQTGAVNKTAMTFGGGETAAAVAFSTQGTTAYIATNRKVYYLTQSQFMSSNPSSTTAYIEDSSGNALAGAVYLTIAGKGNVGYAVNSHLISTFKTDTNILLPQSYADTLDNLGALAVDQTNSWGYVLGGLIGSQQALYLINLTNMTNPRLFFINPYITSAYEVDIDSYNNVYVAGSVGMNIIQIVGLSNFIANPTATAIPTNISQNNIGLVPGLQISTITNAISPTFTKTRTKN